MSAIVEELRKNGWRVNPLAAADEIERLLRLLQTIRSLDAEYNYFNGPHGGWIRQKIDEALGQKEAADV